jgi:hypothetical protein
MPSESLIGWPFMNHAKTLMGIPSSQFIFGLVLFNLERNIIDGGWGMETDTSKLDEMQNAYKAAVEKWIAAIREEEALASVNHSVAEVDKWEAAHFKEDEIRREVKAAKKDYEDALRQKFFGF